MKANKSNSKQLYRVESVVSCAGQFERHTLREWKRIYGYAPGHPFVKLIQDAERSR
jgi:hypothetical protein